MLQLSLHFFFFASTWMLETLRKWNEMRRNTARSGDVLKKSKLIVNAAPCSVGTAMASPRIHDLNGPAVLSSCANLNLGVVSLSRL